MTLVLRPLSPEDVSEVVTIMQNAFDPRYGESWRGEQVTDALQTTSWGRFALLETAPAGFALVRSILDESELLLIAVDPKYRNRGIGGRLLTDIIRSARQRGSRALFLEMREGNLSAESLYQRYGFQPASRRRDYYRGPDGAKYDAITMKLSLDTMVLSS